MLITRILILVHLVLFVPFAAAGSCNIGPVSSICSQQDVEVSLQPDFGAYFTDVKFDAEFWPYVKILAAKSIIQKSTLFRPNSNITRAEALKMLMRSLDVSSPEWRNIQTARQNVSMFDDVQKKDWYYNYVNDALKYGFINSGKLFRPDEPITRQEFAEVAYNAMTSVDPSKAKVEKNSLPFKDDVDIYPTILAKVYSLRANGVISGYSNGYFKPKENIKRAHMAKIITRTFFPLEANLRFSLGQDYKNDSDDVFVEAFASNLIKELQKDKFWRNEGFYEAEAIAKKAIKAAALASIVYLRKHSGLQKTLVDELIKSFYGDATGLPGKIITQLTIKKGFWETIRSTFKMNKAGFAMILVDVMLDTAASTGKEIITKNEDAVAGAIFWRNLKLVQLTIDISVGYASGRAVGAISGALGVTFDSLWEDAKLTSELIDVTFEVTRSERIVDCHSKVVAYVDRLNSEIFEYVKQSHTSYEVPDENSVIVERIAYEANECLDPRNQIFFLFSDSDKDAWAAVYVRRFLKGAAEAAFFQRCIQSGQSQCGLLPAT